MTGKAGDGRKSLRYIHDDVEYYPHQIEGVRIMARMASFLLCDEMGLGKSLEALTVAAIDFERGWASKMICVVPATLKWNWAEEISKHTSFRWLVLDGTPKDRLAQLVEFQEDEIHVLIVNYEQVKSHLDVLNGIGFDIAVFDEAHYIKSRKAQRTKAAHALKCQRAFVLTGSPLLNQVNDLWGLLHRVDPAVWPDYWRFVNRFAVMGGFKNKQIIGVKNKAELTAQVDQVMIRRLKRDVLDLPEKQYIDVAVDFHPKQHEYYIQAEDELKIDIPNSPTALEIENVLTKMLRLKQICGTPAAIGAEDDSYKLDRAIEMIEEIVTAQDDSPGEPVVVFTQFRGVLAAMSSRLDAARGGQGIPTWVLHGDVPISDRIPAVTAWANHKNPAVLLCMLQVGGVGLNMTAASRCIFLDKLWTPKMNEQAEDRLHRIGADKTKPIQIYHIFVRKSVEQRVERILRAKRKLFNALIEESEWKQRLIQAMLDEDQEEE